MTPDRMAEIEQHGSDYAEALADRNELIVAVREAWRERDEARCVRRFPLQVERQIRGTPRVRAFCLWATAEDAWAVYASRYGRDQSVERMAERGGFGNLEMDGLLPDWRERDDARSAVLARAEIAESELARLRPVVEAAKAAAPWAHAVTGKGSFTVTQPPVISKGEHAENCPGCALHAAVAGAEPASNPVDGEALARWIVRDDAEAEKGEGK